ncbi:MAG: hypothetical protein KDD55_10550, partial [Bdellovibrionales bacterium]|nr:hypothetical protein [Bdellovibrionales bacterium]
RSQALADDIHKLEAFLGDVGLSKEAQARVRELIAAKKSSLAEVGNHRSPEANTIQNTASQAETVSRTAEVEEHLRKTERDIARKVEQLKVQSERPATANEGFSFDELASDAEKAYQEATSAVDELLHKNRQQTSKQRSETTREAEIQREQARLAQEMESLKRDRDSGQYSESAQSVIDEELALRQSKARQLQDELSSLQTRRSSGDGGSDSGDSSSGGGGDTPKDPQPSRGGGSGQRVAAEANTATVERTTRPETYEVSEELATTSRSQHQGTTTTEVAASHSVETIPEGTLYVAEDGTLHIEGEGATQSTKVSVESIPEGTLYVAEDGTLHVEGEGATQTTAASVKTISEEEVFYVTEDGELEVRTSSGDVRPLTKKGASDEPSTSRTQPAAEEGDLYGDGYQSTLDEIEAYNQKMKNGEYDFLSDDGPDFEGNYDGEGGDWPPSGGGTRGGGTQARPTSGGSQGYASRPSFDQGGPALKLQPEPQQAGVAVLEPPQAKASAVEAPTMEAKVEPEIKVHPLEEVILTPEEEAIARQMIEELALKVKPVEAPHIKPMEAPVVEPATTPHTGIKEDVSVKIKEGLDLKLKPHPHPQPQPVSQPSPHFHPAPETKPKEKEEPDERLRRLRRPYWNDAAGQGAKWTLIDKDLVYTMTFSKWELDKLEGVKPYKNIAGKKIIKKVQDMLGEYETFHWHYT